MKWRRSLAKERRSKPSTASATRSGVGRARAKSSSTGRKSRTSSEGLSANSTAKSAPQPGMDSGTPLPQSDWRSPSDTSQTELIPTQSDLSPGTIWDDVSKALRPRTSSTSAYWYPSVKPTLVLLTSTIRFTCPLCSEEHFHAFRWSLSMKRRTYHRLIIKCSKSSEEVGSLALAIPSNQSTNSAEPAKTEWESSETTS